LINVLQNFLTMKDVSTTEFEATIKENEIVAVDFYSTECAPCEALAPKFDSLAELYGESVAFVKVYRQNNRELAQKLGVSSSPTIIFFKGGKQIGSTLAGGIKRSDVVKNLNSLLSPDKVKAIQEKIKPVSTDCDVLIIGGGPGGLAAGIYLAQAKLNTILVDIALPGGQVSTTHKVSNYPGFPEPINGYMLSHYMSEQAKKAGVTMRNAVDITNVDLVNKTLLVDGYETINAKKIIISTGASPRPLGIPGEKEYKGKGISYCATCDAKYMENKEVIIIGGGNSAVEESEFISKFASKITIIHQFDKLTANKEAQEKCFANPKISIRFEHEPREILRNGDKMVVKTQNLKTKEIVELESDGLFVFIGMKPNLDVFEQELQKDSWGYIKTDDEMRTSIAGVYAVGDVISKKYRQITTAVADGTIASIACAKEFN